MPWSTSNGASRTGPYVYVSCWGTASAGAATARNEAVAPTSVAIRLTPTSTFASAYDHARASRSQAEVEHAGGGVVVPALERRLAPRPDHPHGAWTEVAVLQQADRGLDRVGARL